MRKRMGILFCAMVAAVLIWNMSHFLRPRSVHPMLSAMPGAAILGFYAAAAANFLAMAIWHARLHGTWTSFLTRHSLLLLAVSGFCMDYMLNNYAEITTKKDGSYGLVVLIDFLTWGFLWFVSNLYFPKAGKDYVESLIAILLPSLAVLREIANAKELIHMGAATVDLIVGAFFAAAWILLLDFDEQSLHPRYTRSIKVVLSIACMYGALLVTENVLSHFFGVGSEKLRDNGLLNFWINITFVAFATVCSIALFYRHSRRFETLFAAPCI